MKQTKIIAIANQKGGVAKTTSAINIAAGLSLKGKKVLLADVDSQYHLTQWLGYKSDGKPTISELIYQTVAGFKLDYGDFIRSSEKFNIDYIPANSILAGIISIIGTDADSSSVFTRIFSNEYFKIYDYIIFDCGPSLDLLVTNAIKSCTGILIPVQTDMLAYEGVEKMLNTYIQTKPEADIKKSVLMLATMYHKNTTVSKEIFAALKESYGDLVIDVPIPYRAQAVNSSVEKTALVLKKNSEVGLAYLAVVNRILQEDECCEQD